MTKHDTWVYLKPNSPYQAILHLFPNGIPMRDPFPLERANGEFIGVSLWIIDLERLNTSQIGALTQRIAAHWGVSEVNVFREATSQGGFAVNQKWIERMNCGPEGMQRSKELMDFLENAPQPPNEEAFMEFYNDQHHRWIEGNEQPPPMPERIEDFDPRLQTPELADALTKHEINKMLQGYSVFDVLTGRAMTDILNHIDPEHNYELVGWDDILEDDDDYPPDESTLTQ